MKFVIQRVLQGSVKVNEKIVGEIGPGLVVLVGFTHTDKKENLKFAANKLLSMRLWDDANGTRWKESVKDKKYGLLLVSQFTLYSFLKGNKPDYHNALDPKTAVILYDEFLKILKQIYDPEKIQSGMFGEMMQVSLINDGPVTINWEYPELQDKDALSENNKGIENDNALKSLKDKEAKNISDPKTNAKKNQNSKTKNKTGIDQNNKFNNNDSNLNNASEKKEDVFEIEKDLDKLKLKVEEKLDAQNTDAEIQNKTGSNSAESVNPDLIKLPEEMK